MLRWTTMIAAYVAMTAVVNGSIQDSRAFINELHYDNRGRDVNEFVEVAVPLISDLSQYTLTLYNGSSGAAYRRPMNLTQFAVGDVSNGYRFLYWNTSLQNGPRDGFALARGSDVLQFLSYEGTFTATDAVAAGLLSTEIPFSEPSNTTPGLSLQLGGMGDSYSDFQWQPLLAQTTGAINLNQKITSSMASVPEPSTWLMWSILGLLFGCHRLRRFRR